MTLTEFLLARIAEDEAAARAGISSQADPENGWGYGGYGSPRALTPHVGIIHERVQAEHIIRWHPARVLADCESKRRIVEEHRCLSEYDPRGVCNACGNMDASWPCPTVRFLALPYADHPDYQEAWKP